MERSLWTGSSLWVTTEFSSWFRPHLRRLSPRTWSCRADLVRPSHAANSAVQKEDWKRMKVWVAWTTNLFGFPLEGWGAASGPSNLVVTLLVYSVRNMLSCPLQGPSLLAPLQRLLEQQRACAAVQREEGQAWVHVLREGCLCPYLEFLLTRLAEDKELHVPREGQSRLQELVPGPAFLCQE